MRNTYTFRDISLLAKLLAGLLIVGSALAAVSAVSSWLQLQLLGEGVFRQGQVAAYSSRHQTIIQIEAIGFLLTAVIFLCWFYCANRNVRALGADDMRFTPGAAVAVFFVPIFCLWLPYAAMKDLWKTSKNPTGWYTDRSSLILIVWWTLWIMSAYFGLPARMLAGSPASSLDGMKFVAGVVIIAETVNLLLCITALVIVWKIQQSLNAYLPHTSIQ
ncbi:MAG: DUF4328 domain-containing protein [Phycisphaeraceae bacterium]|nr:DUF4328 domain-containing protein [Phycisphaeraceae bacterium]